MATGHDPGQDILSPIIPARASFFNDALPLNTSVDVYLTGLSEGCGTPTNNAPVDANAKTLTGHFGGMYAEIFYNRLHLTPSVINLGLISFEQNREISLWNAYFLDNTLSSVTITGDDEGITLVDTTTPTTFLDLEERLLDLTVSIDGPTIINVSYAFHFDDTDEDAVLVVTGRRRLPVVPIFPLYSTLRESLVWLSDVLTSYNGKEQRIKLRDVPRQRINMSAFVESKDNQTIDNLLFANRASNSWGVPLWQESQLLTAEAFEGAIQIDLETRYGDFTVGGLVIIWISSSINTVSMIAAVADDHLILETPLGVDLPMGSFVAPLKAGYMISNPVRNGTGYNSRYRAQFEITEKTDISADPLPNQYKDIDVFMMEPEKPGGDIFPNTYDRRQDTIDYSTGSVAVFSPYVRGTSIRTIRYLFDTLEDVWEFKKILYRFSGRVVPFYMPTFERNMFLADTEIGSIGINFNIVPNGTGDENDTRKDIIIYLKDGTFLFREITSIEEGDDTSLVAVDTALNVNAADIDYISYLPLWRLDSDTVQIDWDFNNVSVIDLTIREIVQ